MMEMKLRRRERRNGGNGGKYEKHVLYSYQLKG